MLALATNQISTLLLLGLLASATLVDLRCQRVPNLISLGGLVLGLGLNAWFLGLGAQGLLAALGGVLLTLLIFLPFYATGGMGAGDVKLMAMVGAYVDPLNALLAAGLSLAAGSLIGLGILLMRRGAGCMTRRYISTFQCLAITGKWSYVPPAADEAAALRFPYALAIALGTLATLWWSGTLSDFVYLLKDFLSWIIN
jgi:prepilin peptidase CpaA